MIAIIPARYGSKGLKKKNIRLLNGKPLIVWTIKAARKATLISKIIVSTDSKEIANIAKKHGADVPFLRPRYLATDKSKAIDNYIYSMKKLQKLFNFQSDNFVVLQPTSPIRDANDIDQAIKLFYRKKADSVLSCCETSIAPFAMFNLNKKLKMMISKNKKLKKAMNRQEFKPYYTPNGSIYVLNLKNLIKYKSYFSNKSYAYLMSHYKSVDINNLDDFKYAEFLLKKNRQF